MPDATPDFTHDARTRLLPLDPPQWLAQAVAPWRIEAAALWREGVMLELRSDRARIPVRVDSPTAGPLQIVVLDPRIPSKPATAFVRALQTKLMSVAPLRGYLQRLRGLVEALDAGAPVEREPALVGLIASFRAWPQRDVSPEQAVDPLPAGLDAAELPRSVRAALALHRLAAGEPLAGLSAWAALAPEPDRAPSFTELHLDAIALGLLGRRDDATDRLDAAAAVAVTPTQWLTLARAFEAVEQRERAVAAHERVVAVRGREWDRLRLARCRGDFGPGEPVPRPKPESSREELVSFVRELVKILEGAGRYDDALAAIDDALARLQGAAAPVDLAIRAAELHLWRGETERARARIDALAEPARREIAAQVVLGAAAVLDGRHEQALALLDAVANADAVPLELLLWQAEALLALGRRGEALERVDRHIIRENSLCAYLLKLLVLVELEPEPTLTRTFESRTFLDALIVDVLPTLRPAAQIAEARADPERFAALLRGILDDMGGNRGPKPTWRRRDADGSIRLERVVVRPSGRDAAVANLIRIRSEAPAQVLAGFDAVAREYPNSPHPWTYRGELLIWLGRYADAFASFDESDARAPTRWAYVGRAAAHDLVGEAELADHWTREGIVQFGELETATTHVYRGERLRKLADWDAARRDLEIAVAFKTRRIGARINLALVYRALGETASWQRELARLRADAPAFVWEAGGRPERPLDEPTLHAMLELMVGNRSSFLHTMIDGDGRFRVVPEPGRFIAHARLSLASAREELGRAIARLWLAG